ncbi:MAG: hypothetical protein Q9207_001647 [Kuettlingeria erythrocarpa]
MLMPLVTRSHSSVDSVQRILLFKFAKPDHREQILVDPGFRCHLTSFSRATAAAPSQFVAKLRKYLRTRRVTSVSRVGTDRVIELQFSDGQFRLFLEFYAGGNIVLTDRELNILTVLRNVPEGERQEELRVGLKYLLENRQNYGGIPELTGDRVRAALQKSLDKEGANDAAPKKVKKSGDALRKALAASMSEFPPMLIDHVLRSNGFDTSKPIVDVLSDGSAVSDVLVALQQAQLIDQNIDAIGSTQGYIFTKPRHGPASGSPPNAEQANDNFIYEDFQPFKPLQLDTPDWTVLEFESFNKTVDEFFSSIEGQKLESRLTDREQNAKRKLEAAKQDHEKRVGGLQQVQELNIRKAQTIEANLQRVQEAIVAVNGLIGQGMDWVEIARLIEMEKGRHNPVAEMIQLPLKLYENTIPLLLAEEDFTDDEDFDSSVTGNSESDSSEEGGTAASARIKAPKATERRLAVDIDLALSPWSNARQYYDQKKTAAVKEQKTIQSSAKALKSTEKKISADLKKGLNQEKQILRPIRKQLWFEKFLFFISSEGYLVLGGKDAQQNDIMYRRYLKKGDVYVHADLHGAASVVIKNKPGRLNDPIPPFTLSQAGTFAVATSAAWDSKAVMSAWWVYPEQVSKTAPTGEFLTVGSFSIRGEKNFLPPAHLLLGFGVLFRVSEESMVKHLKHRLRDEEPEQSVSEDPGDNVGHDIQGDESMREDDGREEEPQEPAYQTDQHSDEGSQSGSEDDEDSKSMMDYGSGVEDHNPLLSEALAQEGNEQQTSQGTSFHMVTGNEQPAAYAESLDEDDPQEERLDSISEAAPLLAINGNDVPGVHHISAKARRLLRKGHSPAVAAEEVSDLEKSSENPDATASREPSAYENLRTTSQNPHVRGKHGKRNKLKTKYADQDEEDRALALRLLGSAATHRTAEDAAAKAAKEQELAAQKQRRRQQHVIATEKGKEAEEIRRLNLEEGLETLDSTEAEALEDLEAYIGTPLPGDAILDILVVCGPWDAISTRCRWRVKMQPGATKKGKAVREVLSTWTKAIETREKKKRAGAGEGNEIMEEEKTRRREGELLRGLKEQEIVGVVPVGKVRVVMGAEGSGAKGKGAAAVGKGKRGGRGSKKKR